MKILVNGTAGFIGAQLPLRLCTSGDEGNGTGNLSDYCDVILKKARLARFAEYTKYNHILADIADRAAAQEPQWNFAS